MDNMNDVLINVEQFKANNRETVEEIPWHQVRLLSENKYHEFVQKLEATGEKILMHTVSL